MVLTGIVCIVNSDFGTTITLKRLAVPNTHIGFFFLAELRNILEDSILHIMILLLIPQYDNTGSRFIIGAKVTKNSGTLFFCMI